MAFWALCFRFVASILLACGEFSTFVDPESQLSAALGLKPGSFKSQVQPPSSKPAQNRRPKKFSSSGVVRLSAPAAQQLTTEGFYLVTGRNPA